MTTYVILGNIGLLCNIIIFRQAFYRRNSCSMYILFMSINGLFGLNISTIPVIYATNNFNPMNSNVVFCGLQFYLRHLFNEIMRTCLVLACFDQYVSCSRQAHIRALSRYEVARKIIPTITIFWSIIAIIPIMLRRLENNQCGIRSGLSMIFYTIYIVIVVGLFPLTALIVCEILLIKKLKIIKNPRVQPTLNSNVGNIIFRKRDRDMIRMLSVELCFFIITSIPAAIVAIYKLIIENLEKTNEQKEIDGFIIYFTQTFLLYIGNTLSFWVFLVTSRTYRLELKNMLLRLYRLISIE